MPTLTPKDVAERYQRAKARRATWESHWQECYDYALPQCDGFITSSRPGAKKTDKLFDGTAPDAVDQLAASLLSQLTPPWARWIGFTPGTETSPEDREALAPELERAAATVQSHFNRSNFAVEMMLRPVSLADGRLDPDCLRFFEDNLVYSEGNGEAILTVGGRRLVSASCWWDPSYGSPRRGDASVIAAVFTDEDGDYWLQRVRYMEHDPDLNRDVDEATQLCRQVCKFVQDLYLPAVTLETNGLGRFLPGLLRREFGENGIRCAVVETASSRNKDLRIVDAFDAVLAAGRLHAHRDVWNTPFITEMREWRPGGKGRDDGLDAVSGCLLSEPVRLSHRPTPSTKEIKARRNWRPGGGGFSAHTEFDP